MQNTIKVIFNIFFIIPFHLLPTVCSLLLSAIDMPIAFSINFSRTLALAIKSSPKLSTINAE